MSRSGADGSRSIVPVILSAGDSARMGFPKALLPLGEGSFLTAILSKLGRLELGVPIVTLGRHAGSILPVIPKECCRVLINPDPDRGQLSSMKLAVEHTPSTCVGCLFWPVDHPLVSVDLVRDLVNLFLLTRAPIVLPRFGTRMGHPAIFNRSIFRELLDLPMAGGPKGLVQKYREEIAVVTTEESAAVEDIDTPRDYQDWIIDPLAH